MSLLGDIFGWLIILGTAFCAMLALLETVIEIGEYISRVKDRRESRKRTKEKGGN